MLRSICLISTVLLFSCNAPQKSADSQTAPATAEVSSKPPAQAAEPTLESVRADLQTALASVKHLRQSPGDSSAIDQRELRELNVAAQALASELRSWGSALAHPGSNDVRTSALVTGAQSSSQAWIGEIRALGPDSATRRESALGQVREALAGNDDAAQLAALTTLQRVGDVEYDKSPYRSLILPYAQTARGPKLVAALYALRNTVSEPADLALVHEGWQRDPRALDDSILHLLMMFGGGRIEGRSEEIALESLAGYEQHGGNAGINGVWGAHVGPKLEARFLELERSKNPEVRHGAIYFGLSTFADKSPAVIDALIRVLTDPDFNNSGRALWGLGQGVPAESQPKVVDALVDLYNGRSDSGVRERCKSIVQQYGGQPAMDRLAK